MNVLRTEKPLAWGSLDLPLFGISSDWSGNPANPPAAFSLAADPERLWFVASHGKPARLHPKARPGAFLAGLWESDVAELFLADPASGRYLELNLAPNGSWWSCEFSAPRQRLSEEDRAFPEVETFAELAPDGSWVAAMAVPLEPLRQRIGFGETTRGNVTFILGSPTQQFLSAAKLGQGEPDFHRPAQFPKLRFYDHAELPPQAGSRPEGEC